MKNKTVPAQALPADFTGRPALLSEDPDHHPVRQPWIPVVSVGVPFPLEIFYSVCEEMLLHPEWNSTCIMRCDLIENTFDATKYATPSFLEYKHTRTVRRRLLPRKPSDGTLAQNCHFYESLHGADGVLIMIPELSSPTPEAVPFYHPQVAGLAFRYFSSSNGSDGTLQIDYLPLEDVELGTILPGQPYWPSTSRTYRTALQLLSLVAKHGKARASSADYVKRIHHDKVVPREMYQDLYTEIKPKYVWILKEWKESTDPLKHLFEDIAIATFLICLWKIMYPENNGHPPGGFVDVGCGNGLLVYLLHKEGYKGYGVDLRARKSWSLWGIETQLHTTTLSPPELCLLKDGAFPFPEGSFLIGNHADELTPWIPLLASLTPNSGFFNMPCCLHTFDDRFTRQEYTIDKELLQEGALPHVQEDMRAFEAMSRDNGGRYAAYINYLAEITIKAGWRPERESIRIPSTKAWAFVGRNRIWSGHSEETQREEGVKEWIRKIANDSLNTWKPRPIDGKDH